MIKSRYATSLTRTGTNEGNGLPIHHIRTGTSFNFKDGLRRHGYGTGVKTNTANPRRTFKYTPNKTGGHDRVELRSI